MDDQTDRILRQAVSERARAAPSPRPFHAIADEAEQRRTPMSWLEALIGNHQRGLLIGTIAAAAVVGMLSWATLSNDNSRVQTYAAETTVAPTTTTGGDTNPSWPTGSVVESTAILVQVTCVGGVTIVVDVPGDDESQIGDVLNSTAPCQSDGGLVSVSFIGCLESSPRSIDIAAIDGALPDLDTLDYCENSTAETSQPTTTMAQQTTTATAETTTLPTATAAESIAIVLTCADGGSVDSEIPGNDEGQIDDVINSIDFCEGAGGLSSVTFTGCGASSPRTVTIDATNGGLPDFDTLDYCEQ